MWLVEDSFVRDRVGEVYRSQEHASSPDIESMSYIASLFKIDEVDKILSSYTFYWDYLDLVVANIRTGKWRAEPAIFTMYLNDSLLVALPPVEQDNYKDRYMRSVKELLREHNNKGRKILLRWLQHPDGYGNALRAVYYTTVLRAMIAGYEPDREFDKDRPPN